MAYTQAGYRTQAPTCGWFAGRMRRKHYALSLLTLIITYTGATLLIFSGPTNDMDDALMNMQLTLFILVLAIVMLASLSLHIRRIHDRDKSGWNVLWMFVPVIGLVYQLILLFDPGTSGHNSFGYEPDADENLINAFFGKY